MSSRTAFDLMCWGAVNSWWLPNTSIMHDLRAAVAEGARLMEYR